MTLRQKLLKWIYPLFVSYQKIKGKNKILYNDLHSEPSVPVYHFSIELGNGKILPLEKMAGKKILIINTASDCGYTAQYNELQKLYQHSKEDLEIIAFPSNDFKEQEQASDRDIETFCSLNYGIRFPIAKKASVRGESRHPLYHWLSDKSLNGWNNQAPAWNFSKYLINEKGVLTHYFDPAVSPLSEEMIQAIHQE